MWKYRLDVRDIWGKTKDGEMSLADFCTVVVKRIDTLLESMGLLDRMWLKDIRNSIAELAVDSFPEVEDFDDIWDDLYDWANSARCWVATTF